MPTRTRQRRRTATKSKPIVTPKPVIELNDLGCPKRLPIGQSWSGPEWPGCRNSGSEIALLHSKRVKSARVAGLTTSRYLVGAGMNLINFSETRIIWADVKRVWNGKYGKVYLFSNYQSACRKWKELNDGVLAKHAEVREERQRLLTEAQSGHPNALVDLALHCLDN
jgi:hypothetical protein